MHISHKQNVLFLYHNERFQAFIPRAPQSLCRQTHRSEPKAVVGPSAGQGGRSGLRAWWLGTAVCGRSVLLGSGGLTVHVFG